MPEKRFQTLKYHALIVKKRNHTKYNTVILPKMTCAEVSPILVV